jgi:hypothetical protein
VIFVGWMLIRILLSSPITIDYVVVMQPVSLSLEGIFEGDVKLNY